MIYVLLPAYNEEESIDNLFTKIQSFFENEYKSDYQIIICNDGSTDNTLKKIQDYVDKMPIKVIHHKINRGLGESIRDLFEYACELSKPNDLFVRMDCDDTHDPKFLVGMIEKIENGYDVVIASRFEKGGGQEGLNK